MAIDIKMTVELLCMGYQQEPGQDRRCRVKHQVSCDRAHEAISVLDIPNARCVFCTACRLAAWALTL
ncbi:hypothetical protein ALQ36_102977 [Pseudomonas syringae pv. primulae]|uniref:Uncharacterized protein n=1 Tax=Pseudomonas syringae pv. primulae TaxID=251707 RepID=A0A3M5TPA3_9PSED|nr:hypothetical protein ALQ36_102977 [Pseudomonas syringae pv. primulae]RMR15808.1 hypothetical protein ALP92_103043 [Pseudomonas syringae pv. primulae]RMU35405.1 hypothetical protein ALP30_103390 [Pseudomonas syringae pv. primulae]